MKISTLLLGIGLTLPGLVAQAQIRFGVKGGLNSSTVAITNNDMGYVPDANLGWQAGVLADIGISRHFSIQPAVLVATKGFKIKEDLGLGTGTATVEANFQPIYVEVPILAVGKLTIGNSFRIFLGIGPYVAVGVAGKTKIKAPGVDQSENIKYGTDGNSDLKRGDFGGSAAVGVEIGNFLIGANYNYGVANVFPDTGDSKVRNASLGITVGILFGKAKQ